MWTLYIFLWILGGSDYALDNAGEKMSTEEITKLALEALSKKNKEMKKKGAFHLI